jgi:hypothetical protein
MDIALTGAPVALGSAIAGGCRLAQRLQISAVKAVDTQDRPDEIVNGVPQQIARGPWRIPSGFPDD